MKRLGLQLLVVGLLAGVARAALAAPERPGVAVTGVTQDATGGGLPGATLSLTRAAGQETETTTTDAAGAFRFEPVTPGTYDLVATFEGFKAVHVRLRVGARPPKPLTLVLPLANFVEEITISNESGRLHADTASNVDSTTIDQGMLESIPVLGTDVVGALSRFLDAGAIGTSGPTLIVDGLELSRLNLSTAAIGQVKINRDPYAAEFARPGGGRIEVVTKPGSHEYHGNANALFRDAALEARPALAATTPAEQHRVVEAFLGGPLWHSKKTSFTLSTTNQVDDVKAIVLAQSVSGRIRMNVPSPYDYLFIGGTINHQHGDNTSLSIRFWHEDQSEQNRDVGGVVLPEAGATWSMGAQSLSYSHQTILTPRWLNQFRVLVGRDSHSTTSAILDPKIVVIDAFTGGGAQADQQRGQVHFTLTNTLSLSRGRHFFKAGVNVPEWSWRRLDDMTNAAGTFYFSSLAAYEQQRPFSFIQQLGNGHVAFLEKVFGVFMQDELRLTPRLSLALGLRYDWQNYFHDANNFAPRMAFAFAPTEGANTVIRGGAGLFYDRSGPGPIQDLLRYDGAHLWRYVTTNPGYPNLFQAAQTMLTAVPPSLVRFATDINIPSRLQYSIGIEHQVSRSTNLSFTYTGARGYDLFRSRDVNAPLPPIFRFRPDSSLGIVRQVESAGKLASHSWQFSVRGKATRFFNGSIQYTLGHAYNDTSGINWMPPNAYDLSGEYARADFDQRHRLDFLGTLNVGSLFNVGVAVALYSGKPYSITTGLDDFNDGLANARPIGIPRNSTVGPDYADLDLRLSREVWSRRRPKARGPSLTAGIDAFNVWNRINYSSYVGTLTSPFFGRAVSAEPPRRLQLSLRFQF